MDTESVHASSAWSLCRRDDGAFVVKYKDASGDWRQHRVPTDYRNMRQARVYAQAWLDELRHPPATPRSAPPSMPAAKGTSLRDLARDWLRLRREDAALAPATHKADEINLATHILPAVGQFAVDELTTGVLRPFIRSLKVKRAPSTVLKVASTLTTLIDDAMAEEWIAIGNNPMRHPGVRKELPAAGPVGGRKDVIYVQLPNARRLVTCAEVPFDWRTRYLVGFTSGLRRGELAGLFVDDVAFEADVPYLDVNKALQEVGRNGRATLGPPKRPESIRLVPLHSVAMPVLRAWVNEGWKVLVGRDPTPNDPLFPDEHGGLLLPACARAIRRDLLAAGCPVEHKGKPIDFHATRRSFSTWLNDVAAPEATVGRLLGQAGRTVNQRHYTAAVLSSMRKVVELIDLGIASEHVVSPHATPRP